MWSRGVSLRMVLRNCWMLVLAALIAGMGAKLVLDWLWTPEYTSTITYAVLSKSASATSWSNYNVANEVAIKYSSMLESNLMKDRINQALGWTSFPVPSRPRWRGGDQPAASDRYLLIPPDGI